MFHSDFIPFFEFQLRISRYFSSHTVYWDISKSKLISLNSTKTRVHKIGIFLLVIRTCFMLWKTLEVSQSKEKAVQQKIIAGYISFAMLVATVAVVAIFVHTHTICSFVNLLPYFEGRLKGNQPVKRDKTIRSLSYLGFISINVIATSFSLLNVFFPCAPPYFGSHFVDCETSSWTNWAIKGSLITFEIWMNFFVCSNAMWGGFFLLFGGILFIKKFLKQVQEFPYGTEIFRLYKELQILVDIFNEIHQTGILPMTQMSVVGLPVFSIFLTIKFYDEIPMSLFLFNIAVILDSILFQVIAFGVAGSIHSTSEKIIDEWKRNHFRNKIKAKRLNITDVGKLLASLPSIQIKFGSNNFLEKDTCLNVIQLTLTLVANMLLSSQSSNEYP